MYHVKFHGKVLSHCAKVVWKYSADKDLSAEHFSTMSSCFRFSKVTTLAHQHTQVNRTDPIWTLQVIFLDKIKKLQHNITLSSILHSVWHFRSTPMVAAGGPACTLFIGLWSTYPKNCPEASNFLVVLEKPSIFCGFFMRRSMLRAGTRMWKELQLRLIPNFDPWVMHFQMRGQPSSYLKCVRSIGWSSGKSQGNQWFLAGVNFARLDRPRKTGRCVRAVRARDDPKTDSGRW